MGCAGAGVRGAAKKRCSEEGKLEHRNGDRRNLKEIKHLWMAIATVVTGLGWQAARAQEAFPAPEPSPAVKALLSQAYLSDEERRRLRVEHGVWEEGDLVDDAARARAALVRGALDDASLLSDLAGVEDRAEAMVRRGEPAKALALLDGRENARAVRLRVDALADLGRWEEAGREAASLGEKLTKSDSADEVAEAARAMVFLARVRGPSGEGVVGYQAILDALARARDQLDRLSWRVNLSEALLLYEKDKYADVGAAIQTVLALNPKCAEAWALYGRVSVDGFDFPRAQGVAARLEEVAGGPTADSAVVRALALIRQGEGAGAEAALKDVIATFPGSRELLSTSAAAAAAQFDFDAADAALEAFENVSPGSPVAYLEVGRAMASARQYDEAAGYLRTAAERAPNWALPTIELGLSELQAGRDDAARTALERAAELDAFNVRASNSLTLLRELRGYARLESEHFVVRYKPGDDEVLAPEMLPVLERIHARVTGAARGGIDHVPPYRTTVELYPNHHWFSVRITGMPRIHTIAAATGPVIAMEAPRVGPGHKVGPFDWARVVQHEFVHTVTLSRTKNRLPHWFTEAGAVYLEDSPRDYRTVQLLARAYETQELFDLDDINTAFVRPRKQTDRALAYAQGHWMYEFMIDRWGTPAPLELMDLYAAGVREGDAFQQALGTTREMFLADFRAWAGLELERWGMLAIDAVPDVPGLMSRDEVTEPGEDEVEKWLAEFPTNPFVLEAAVAGLAAKGPTTPEEVAICERYAAARPVDPLPHRLLAAMYLSRAGEEAGAVPHLEYLDAREQSTPGYAIELGRRYLAANEHGRAMAKAARATQISPYDAKVREFAATVAMVAGDLTAAERHIRALVMLEPERELHKQRLEAVRRKLEAHGETK